MPDASPIKWHLAHTTWFFETFVLERFEANFRPHDERFRVLFNSYYNGIGAKHPRAQRGLISRPNLQDVRAYRQAVDERVQTVLAELPQHPVLLALLELGIQHEQQHQELILTDIKHVLSCNPAQPAFAKRWPLAAIAPSAMQWLGFEGGLVQTGQPGTRAGFCFDNEAPQHKVWLAPFELANRPVTYGDYLAFMLGRQAGASPARVIGVGASPARKRIGLKIAEVAHGGVHVHVHAPLQGEGAVAMGSLAVALPVQGHAAGPGGRAVHPVPAHRQP